MNIKIRTAFLDEIIYSEIEVPFTFGLVKNIKSNWTDLVEKEIKRHVQKLIEDTWKRGMSS